MTTLAPNDHGVDPGALARQIERWLASDPDRTATQLAQHACINPRAIWQIRHHQRPHCTLDIADRLTLAMDIHLSAVAPPPPEASRDAASTRRQVPQRCGKRLDAHVRHISAEDLKLARELHQRGIPLRRIARHWQQSGRITYKSENAAASSLYELFRARGWQRQDRIAMVRRVSTTHGRAGRVQARRYGPDYAAYRRQQRKRNGDLRDVRCASTNTSAKPCRRWALTNKEHCVAHDPARETERREALEAAWRASRARMLRWGDHRPQALAAIRQHGRPALCRASGISTTVLGRILHYDEEHPIKPETWGKLLTGIQRLDHDHARMCDPRSVPPVAGDPP